MKTDLIRTTCFALTLAASSLASADDVSASRRRFSAGAGILGSPFGSVVSLQAGVRVFGPLEVVGGYGVSFGGQVFGLGLQGRLYDSGFSPLLGLYASRGTAHNIIGLAFEGILASESSNDKELSLSSCSVQIGLDWIADGGFRLSGGGGLAYRRVSNAEASDAATVPYPWIGAGFAF